MDQSHADEEPGGGRCDCRGERSLARSDATSSCTDEVPSSASPSSSDGPRSWPGTSESEPDSEEPTTDSGVPEEQSEPSDLQINEVKVSKQWIDYLKSKATDSEGHRLDGKRQSETPRGTEEELNALQAFCTLKVNSIQHRRDSKVQKSSRPKKLRVRLDSETSVIDAVSCTIPDELWNRIYLKNMTATLAHMATVKPHISSRCPDCLSKKAELAQSDFLKRKKTLLESLLLREKIDEFLYTTDFLTRVVQVRQGLPRLSDDPRIIWKRLKEKIQLGRSAFEKTDAEQKEGDGDKETLL